ncbi:unnamed protein product [Hermetia illucens]|uniref:Beta-sarcoglycan n=1 Tax=Hermetia illucens TaxID=343691 RepID=A0A7R8Z3F8_HERIL|nr:beta-sarcoglycan [Hermetia illucens]CAD7091907.1 unnamed protein product [Hermetia illucens]
MPTIGNTLIQGPSSCCSDDLTSENEKSTLPIGERKFFSEIPQTPKMKFDSAVPQKTSLHGRNTFAFWLLVSLLFILAVGNLLITITIVGVLKMGKGIHGLELIENEDSVKFFGTADLDRIYKRDGALEGFMDQPVSISGEDGPVLVNFIHRSGHTQNKLAVGKVGVQFRGVDKFDIKDPVSGEVIFTTHRPHYNIPKGADNLQAKVVSTSRITSPLNKTLSIVSDEKISVRGSEGLFLESMDASFKAEQNIVLKAMNGSVVLSGNDGIYLDVENIPVVNSDHGIRTGSVQYKLCVCMPQGKLFKVAVPRIHNGKITCLHFNPQNDPCM